MSPLQAFISLGSGMQPGGFPELSQRFGSAANGNSARAESVSTNVRPAATASERWRIGGTPLRAQSAGAAGADGSPQPSGGVDWGRGAAGSNPQAGTIPRGHRGQVRGTKGGAPPDQTGCTQRRRRTASVRP